MKAYSLANKFLTIIPWPAPPDEYGPREACTAVVRFPLVGLALGLILVAGDIVLGVFFPAPVLNGFLVMALVVLSGGKPVGAVTAWAESLWRSGGENSVDLPGAGKPSAGLPGSAAMAGILLLKFAALLALPGAGRWSALILGPALGRAAMAYLIVKNPDVSKEGAGDPEENPSPDDGYALIGWTLAISLVFGFIGGIVIALAAGVLTLVFRRAIERWKTGESGDVHAAGGEIIEIAVFLLCAAWWGA